MGAERSGRWAGSVAWAGAAVLWGLVCVSPAWAQLTQEQFLKSVSNQSGEPVNLGKILTVAAGGGVLLLLLFVFSRLQKRQALPKPLHSHGKLMREVLRQVPIKSTELKRLRVLADARRAASPLTLLLCPSLLPKPPRPAGADKSTR